MRDIRVMLEQIKINERRFASVYQDAKGEERNCFNPPKRETMILVSGYSVELRTRIIDRLKLEGGHKLLNAHLRPAIKTPPN